MNLFNNLQFLNHPLNKKHKTEAIIRFLRWQIGSRIVPGEIVYHWINDTKFIVHPGETGLTGNIYCGLHEFADMAYVLHVLNPDELFIDIGANVGSYSILACGVKKAYGYCFEPIPLTFERLLENIRLNNLIDRVIALNIGLSDAEGELAFTADENCTNHVVTDLDSTTSTVRTRVALLDDILQDCDPHLMKIDVEGFETKVINGSHNTLKKESLHSVIIEFNKSGRRYNLTEDSILTAMSEHGFKPYIYEPFSRELKITSDFQSESGNILFVRNLDLILERIKNSPEIYIHGVAL
jgi:FkbM family methyltransferase